MNGGVNTIVAGELAKAAFQNGFETYGVDILERLIVLMKKHDGDLPVSYTPEGKVDEGIPDNWGQAAVYSALIEGLAGVVDKSSQFAKVEVSPRWLAAGKDSAEVSVVYGPTGTHTKYTYLHEPKKKSITIKVSGNMRETDLRILLPSTSKKVSAWVNGIKVQPSVERHRLSQYMIITGNKGSVVEMILTY
ncbi:hypothetical protein ACX0G7_01480 [Flavitalea antarctica]